VCSGEEEKRQKGPETGEEGKTIEAGEGGRDGNMSGG